MAKRTPYAKYVGAGLLVAGSLVLTLAILALIPGDYPAALSSGLVTQLVVDIVMLLTATFMVSTGMFMFIYAGEWGSVKRTE